MLTQHRPWSSRSCRWPGWCPQIRWRRTPRGPRSWGAGCAQLEKWAGNDILSISMETGLHAHSWGAVHPGWHLWWHRPYVPELDFQPRPPGNEEGVTSRGASKFGYNLQSECAQPLKSELYFCCFSTCFHNLDLKYTYIFFSKRRQSILEGNYLRFLTWYTSIRKLNRDYFLYQPSLNHIFLSVG